ncbi:translation elongation factor-like protein [Candidatus Omnitrophota bacterium]
MAKKKKKRALRKPAKKRTVKRRKPTKRKTAKRKPAKKAEGKIIGLVTHYFPHVRAAVIKLKGTLTVGEIIKIKGHTTDFRQTVTSLQIDRVPVDSAKKGAEVGLLSNFRVRHGDIVYKV